MFDSHSPLSSLPPPSPAIPQTTMAKSLRSKTKREFRSKKRESGVYAATEAARLHRLNSKLKVLVSKDLEGDVPVEDVEGGEELPGWCWFATFGLLDANDISAESLSSMGQEYSGEKPSKRCRRRRSSRHSRTGSKAKLQEELF